MTSLGTRMTLFSGVAVAAGVIIALSAFGATSYSTARWIGDWKCLPLEYPWCLVDYVGTPRGIQLEDWRVLEGEKNIDSPPLPVDCPPEKVHLQRLKCIERMALANGLLYGVRDLFSPPPQSGSPGTPIWFVHSLRKDQTRYFETEVEFKKACRELGLESGKLRSFGDLWEERSRGFLGRASGRMKGLLRACLGE